MSLLEFNIIYITKKFINECNIAIFTRQIVKIKHFFMNDDILIERQYQNVVLAPCKNVTTARKWTRTDLALPLIQHKTTTHK